MEKLLKVNFFKERGFPTKKEGMEFIRSHKKLSDIFDQYGEELDCEQERLIEEFGEQVDSFKQDLEKAVKLAKEKQKERIAGKKKSEMENMKQQIIEEYEKQKEQKKKQEENIERQKSLITPKNQQILDNLVKPFKTFSLEHNLSPEDSEKITQMEEKIKNTWIEILEVQQEFQEIVKKYSFDKKNQTDIESEPVD